MAESKQNSLYRRRQRVIEALKRSGPASAARLAEELEVTAMAVRQHLYGLEKEGIVCHSQDKPGGQGRPVKLWRLTDAAAAFFPDGHGELAAGLLEDMRTALGETAMQALIVRRSARQVEDYRQRLENRDALEERLQGLAALRSAEGYMAEIKDQGDGSYLLIENHCAICAAARACTGLCAQELECFQAVLGEKVQIERISHILSGAARCAYRIAPRD